MTQNARSSEDSIAQFIIAICETVKNIGPVKASTIAYDFEDEPLHDFISASEERFARIKKSNGKRILNDTEINGILLEKEPIPSNLSIEETWIFYLGRKFLINQVQKLSEMNFDNWDINPLLAIALNFKTPEEVVKFNVYQSVTRSVVTSWGSTVEQMLMAIGCKPNDYTRGKLGSNFDAVKSIAGIDHYIQIKSGPNSMNVSMVTALNQAFAELEENKTNAFGILGLTYGKPQTVSSQIRSNLLDDDKRLRVGRELWDFVSGQKDYHQTIFQILDLASQDILDESFTDLIDKKIEAFLEQWYSNYEGLSVVEVLERYI